MRYVLLILIAIAATGCVTFDAQPERDETVNVVIKEW